MHIQRTTSSQRFLRKHGVLTFFLHQFFSFTFLSFIFCIIVFLVTQRLIYLAWHDAVDSCGSPVRRNNRDIAGHVTGEEGNAGTLEKKGSEAIPWRNSTALTPEPPGPSIWWHTRWLFSLGGARAWTLSLARRASNHWHSRPVQGLRPREADGPGQGQEEGRGSMKARWVGDSLCIGHGWVETAP